MKNKKVISGIILCMIAITWFSYVIIKENERNENAIDEFIIESPVYKPSLEFGNEIGFGQYEDQEISFIINGQEVLRFYEDSIIIYFKGKTIVITDDSLCNTLNKITEETFK